MQEGEQAFKSRATSPQPGQYASVFPTKLRPDLKRNRALTHAYLAHAQLGQHETELAVATAYKIPAQARHGRTARLLNAFGRRLNGLAPDAPITRDWFEKELL
ncbi:hypothetical protein [Streptomyces cellulosae]|uniref:Uncharacterized protein n=1 Tax=Streptomyces cellulosae TaxID=1968 RepID=A0ABW7Y7I3_STRCE